MRPRSGVALPSRGIATVQLLALHTAIGLLARLGDRRLTRLGVVVSTDPEMASVLGRARSDIRWAWFREMRYRWSDRVQWSHWWAMKRISLRRKWIEWKDRWWLFRNGNRLRSGAAIGPLIELCHEATNNECLIDQRIVSDADYTAWEPTALREFARLYETDPRTDAELFRIVLNRLTDIKDDVEHSDNSLREEVQRGADEYVLRRWLARKLNERSAQRYTIPQEEIDQEERPDLRAQNPYTAPVSIELKWADNWTLAKLLERLENQLVGQYLRAERSRYGIYVLATDGRQRHWRSPDGNLDFNQVIERVARRAEELKRTRPGIGDLRVVPLDFRAP